MPKVTSMQKAIFYILILPTAIRNKVTSFLTKKEQSQLLLNQKKIKFNFPTSNLILKELSTLNLKKEKKKNISYTYLVLVSFLFVGSLLNHEFETALYFLIYLPLGFFVLNQYNDTYWQFRFIHISFSLYNILFAVFCYLFIYLFLNWYLPTEFINYNLFQEKYYFFLIQAILVAPILEEIFFRDYLYELFTLSEKHQKWLSILIPSILFSFIHIKQTDQFLLYFQAFFIAGLTLAILRWYTKNLFYCSTVHIAFNITSFLS